MLAVEASAFGFNAVFAAAQTPSLTAGDYTNATRSPFNGSGLSINTNVHYASVPHDYSTIQAAIDAARTNQITIITVAPGIYFEHLDLKGKPIRLQSAAGPEQTILDGDYRGAVITCWTHEQPTTQIRGFTIQKGLSVRGGGITLGGSSPTIVSNIFRLNEGGFADGAAIEGTDASPLIINNTFQNNVSYEWHNGAISFADASSPVIANNVFVSNACAAINLDMPEQNRRVVVNNTLVGNTAGIRLATYSHDAGDDLANNLLADNGTQLEVTFRFGETVLPDWKNNLIYPSQSYTMVEQIGINGNISAPPAFVCPESFNFRLLTNSPGIDVGAMVQDLPQNDFDNNPRALMGGTGNVLSKTNTGPVAIVDIGAFEFDPAHPGNRCIGLVCPNDITVVVQPGEPYAIVDFPFATAAPEATVACDPLPFSYFPVGTNVVTCTATLGTNIETSSFNIVVVDAAFSIEPVSQTIEAGSKATFRPILDGDDVYIVDWKRNGEDYPYQYSYILDIDNVQAADEGDYTATVLRRDGSYVTRGPAHLHVKPAKPTITLAPESRSVRAGDNAFFYLQAKGSEPINFQWYREGRPIWPRPHERPPFPGFSYNFLQISDAQRTNAGRYTIVASNAYGFASTNFTITVHGTRPLLHQVPPPAQNALNGSDVTFYCSASGSEPMRYQWQLNGHNIPRANNQFLHLRKVTTSFDGRYTIVVSNALGRSSASCDLKIHVRPKLVALPPSTLAITGHDVTLRTRAIAGDKPIAYEWYRNIYRLGGPPNSGPGWRVIVDGPTLTIPSVTAADSDTYEVGAQNRFASDGTATHLIVAPVPSRVYAWGDNSAGQSTPPQNLTNAIAIAAGGSHSLALRANGTVVAWGSNADGQCTVPVGLRNVVAISAGRSHSLALRNDGTIVGWGNNQFGQCHAPTNLPKTIIAIAAGDHHNVALTINHQVAAWGDNSNGQCDIYYYSSMIAAGGDHSFDWSDTAGLHGWGADLHGEIDIPSRVNWSILTPSGRYYFPPSAIAAGKFHSVATGYDDYGQLTAICWGDNTFGQCTPPEELTDVMQVGAGDSHTIALTDDGTIYCWGDNTYGQLNPPQLPGPATAIATGANHNLVLIGH